MRHGESRIRIDDREELIYMLAEAAAIEHNVMCCYFYGIWSLKRGVRDGLTDIQAETVAAWKRAMTAVAVEEMTHLTLVGNLSCAIGAAPHLSRPNFPIPFNYHPAAIDLELFGFSHALIDHAIFLERPEGVQLHDASEFVPIADYHRSPPKKVIMPRPQDYQTIGHLYRGILHGFQSLAHRTGETKLFCGDPADQIGPADAPLPGLCLVTDLASARQAIETIVEQGEGAPEHSETSHYQKFLNMRADLERMQAQSPDFAPAFPVARNPVMNKPLDASNRVWISNPEAASVLDLANAIYNHMLRLLVQAYGRDPGEADHKRLFVTLARELMSVLTPICEHLASLPANRSQSGINAGMTFTMLRDIARLPSGDGEMTMLAERLQEIAAWAGRLFPEGHELDGLAGAINGMAARIVVPNTLARRPRHIAQDDRPRPAAPDDQSEAPDLSIEEGKDLVLNFRTSRCIHARFCVLGAPDVFLANVKGQWLFPDKMAVENLRGICHNCPSGAISYIPKGNTPPEPAPQVNVVNLRENGPYAFRAPLKIDDEDHGFRATLCRCGASKNKPFCDGSHLAIGFRATGEPDTRPSEPLKVRNGALNIAPQKNGPLQITGSLEILSGTGRQVDRVVNARFCRCGGSKTKPFCDNTHLKIGFKSA
jgi:CDGSH-type Zn-finger protein/uncharacterized Fe-S cluster protein YjdI